MGREQTRIQKLSKDNPQATINRDSRGKGLSPYTGIFHENYKKTYMSRRTLSCDITAGQKCQGQLSCLPEACHHRPGFDFKNLTTEIQSINTESQNTPRKMVYINWLKSFTENPSPPTLGSSAFLIQIQSRLLPSPTANIRIKHYTRNQLESDAPLVCDAKHLSV